VHRPVTRDQIAYYVGNAFTITSVSRTQLLRAAYNNNAPHEVITELLRPAQAVLQRPRRGLRLAAASAGKRLTDGW
jgi:hypothetical protein